MMNVVFSYFVMTNNQHISHEPLYVICKDININTINKSNKHQ